MSKSEFSNIKNFVTLWENLRQRTSGLTWDYDVYARPWWKLTVFLHNHKELLRWIALDTSADEPCGIHAANAGGGAPWQLGFPRLTRLHMWLPRACAKIDSKSNLVMSFLSLENFPAKFHGLLCIFWHRIVYHSQNFQFRMFGETRVHAGHFVFAWTMHYPLGRS